MSMTEPTRGVEDGFALYPSLFGANERSRLLGELATVPRSRAGIRHLLGNPAVAAVAHDARLLDVAQAFLGTTPFPYRATLFEKSETSNWLVVWHQDTALPFRSRFDATGWGPWSVKDGVRYAHAPATALSHIVALRVHLDASEASNGPLRVVPSSHRLGVLTDAEIARTVAESQAVDCIVPAGGVLAMRPLLLHSSGKAIVPAPRRIIHIEYTDSIMLGPGELAVA
jgi:ectoine hydroxylase-related dioxygenase (phytanoyl-CoA dioxygenase family)